MLIFFGRAKEFAEDAYCNVREAKDSIPDKSNEADANFDDELFYEWKRLHEKIGDLPEPPEDKQMFYEELNKCNSYSRYKYAAGNAYSLSDAFSGMIDRSAVRRQLLEPLELKLKVNRLTLQSNRIILQRIDLLEKAQEMYRKTHDGTENANISQAIASLKNELIK